MSIPVVLLSHPATPCPAVAAIDVGMERTAAGDLALSYRLRGPAAAFIVPEAQPPGFADGLWQHTCFEAFVAVAGSGAYREFNFSPSGQWAAYAFSGYRQRDESFRPAPAPALAVRRWEDGVALEAVLPAALLPEAVPGATWQLGLSAVVESRDGRRSYWALAHPAPQPDFHHREAFVLPLPIPGPST